MQQSFDNWRAAQPDGGPTLRQELAYKDGFEAALKLMHTLSMVVLVGDVDQRGTPPCQNDLLHIDALEALTLPAPVPVSIY